MQLLKIKKYINKNNGKVIKIIQSAKNIESIYDYQDMGDFVSTTGTNVLYGKKKYGLKQEDILDEIKKTLKKKI
jgi:hypothetical protein